MRNKDQNLISISISYIDRLSLYQGLKIIKDSGLIIDWLLPLLVTHNSDSNA
ncbi:hypothetical protein [Photobacterium nomapromontoriensis]|uniref:hypothetical protein n=1 Tax=Photobacterium nomapromontoriensis TaxID=2910237 RepID=UPI003D117375